MKELNSGCPFQGVDLNSGWNCTPMNQGCMLCGSSTISVSCSRCVSAAITRPALRSGAHGAAQVRVLIALLYAAVGILPLGDQRDHRVRRGGFEFGAVGVGQ